MTRDGANLHNESSFPFTVIGNWKMHKTLPDVKAFLEAFSAGLKGDENATCGLAVPFTAIKFAADICAADPALKDVLIGAQNMNDASSGAFTGEIAGTMLLDAGAKFVLLGHSERRRYFHETDALIHNKIKRALHDGIPFILCIGETAAEREEGKTEEVLLLQLQTAFQGISQDVASLCTIAYEPVWSIGTGQTATVEEIAAAGSFIQNKLAELGVKAPLLYGGSVNSKNAATFAQITSLNGFLVGGASLEPAEFMKIFGAKSSNS